MINWRVRLSNPVFLCQVGASIVAPILVYFGLTVKDITTWGAVLDIANKAIQNPYVVGIMILSAWNAVNDPTTKGLADSSKAMTYTEPK